MLTTFLGSEPSASLDPQAEQALFKRVHALSSGEDGKRTTTIFISHRIQTVRRADKIVVVEGGVSQIRINQAALMLTP